jgi:hypothetical protein
MTATYDLLSDFPGGDDLLSQSPYWAIGIIPFSNQITYDPMNRDETGERSISAADTDALETNPRMVLTSEVTRISVVTAKGSHVSNMSLTLAPYANFLTIIHPGDWVVACILNSEDEGIRVANQMRNNQPVNNWKDGLKFVGRVNSIYKTTQVDQNGVKNIAFDVACVGNGELDSNIFYHPQLAKENSIPVSMLEFGVLVDEVTVGDTDSNESGSIDLNLILPKLFNTIFGVGAWSSARGLSSQPASPNTKYIIPQSLGNWLGIETTTLNDIFRLMIGLHHYQVVSGTDETTQKNPWTLFQPDGLEIANGYYKTGTRLTGYFALQTPPMQGTVWSILSTWLNDPLNEMYVTLRASNDRGKILPHLIVRQNPYSTNQAAAIIYDHKAKLEARKSDDYETLQLPKKSTTPTNYQASDYEASTVWNRSVSHADATDFLELPRWKINPALVLSERIGRGDAPRINFVSVSTTGYGSLVDPIGSFVRSPPIRDSLDIKRNGLRPYQVSVNGSLRDLRVAPQLWRDIMADIVMGTHLTLNGNIVLTGITAPIAVGDNAEVDNIVYHIEGVSHTAAIHFNGQKTFNTVLDLSHGVYDIDTTNTTPSRSDRFPVTGDSNKRLGTSQDHITATDEKNK